MLGKRWQWVIAAVAAVLLPIQALAAEMVTLPYVRESSTEITVEIPPENVPEAGVNPLTGESWQGAYHPVMVQIDADPDALPHWGVAAADVMYEMPLHMAGNTRSVALFMSNMPPYAGPVRSSRVPMASLREMWGAAWVFCGTQQDWRGTNTTIDVADFVLSFHEEARQGGRWLFPFLDGIDGQYTQLFERRNDGNHVAPHNLSIYTQGVSSLFTYEPAKRPFQFTDEPLNRGTDVSGITINYREKKPRFISSYEYDPSTGLYTRYRENVPYIDGISGETCRYSNVIVLYTRVDWYNGAQSRPVIRLIGQGTADIFQNGKWIRGSWVRGAGEGQQYEMDEKALDGRMVFFDESGKELTFQRGKTFIQIVDEHRLDVSVTTNEYIEGGNPQPTPKPTKTPRPTRTPKPTRIPKPTRPPLRQVPAYTKSYVVITNDLAKIRMKPGTDGILLDYAYEGETFIFLGRKNNKWLSLQLPDGTVGYVSAGMAKVVGEEFAK